MAEADEAPLMETVAGFYRVDPPGFRAFNELRPTDDRPAKAMGMTLDRAGTATRNAQRQEFWRSRAALWNELEADRLRASRRWMPFNVPSQGLLTCHGGTLDSWCSLLCVMAAQWVWRQEPSVVIDSSNEVGAELSEFLAGMRPEAPDLCWSGTVENALYESLVERGDRHFDLTSALGRENLLTALFGYADGVGVNRVESELADYEVLLRDVATAASVEDRPCDLPTAIAALLFLVSASDDAGLSREQVQALDRVRRRYEDSPLRHRLLARLETALDLLSSTRGAQGVRPRSASLIDVLTSTPVPGASGRTVQQRLTAELAIGMLQSLPPASNVALVFSDFDDHATPFLNRLGEAARRRSGMTLVLFPRFDGNIGEWVTRSHQAGPLIQRLQDADDAERAAKFFGQEHRFIVTQRTFERGQNTSDNWSNSTSTNFGRMFSVTGGTGRSSTSGSSWSKTESRTTGRTVGTSQSESETSSRVLEFEVNPVEFQRMGGTCGIVRDQDDRVPIGIDSYPLLWLVAEEELELYEAFEQRWGVSPDDMVLLPPTYATLDRLAPRGLPSS